jgi:hypothetical protein
MGMRYCYDFFDRDVFDHIWGLRWKEFQKRYPSQWAMNKSYEPGAYYNESLRGLVCFELSEESGEVVEDVIARRTIRWTIQQVTSQAHLMGEVIEHVPGYRKSYGCVLAANCDPLIAAAVQAFFDGRVGASTVWAVIKLHSLQGFSTDPRQWVRLSGKGWRKVHSIIAKGDLWRPAYPWQGPNAFADYTNWLGVESSRRFIQFTIRAWAENWPGSGLAEPPEKFLGDSPMDRDRSNGDGYRFRDFYLPQELHKIFRRISRFKRPCVVCSWG